MNIYGFMIVKDEADILAQTIQSLLRFGGFRKIFIYDNHSSDGTLDVARRFASDQVIVDSLNDEFSDQLKYDNVYRHQHLFNDGDWFAILDADEIYQEFLAPLIQKAAVNSHNCIEARSAQFYFTEQEDNQHFEPEIPAEQQRRHYLLNYGEPRIFLYEKGHRWAADKVKQREAHLSIAPERLLIHHFQFRSAQQTQRRIEVRIQNNKHSNNWGHINSDQWKNYVIPAKYLHRYDGCIREGLPENANLYKIRNNPAYTMANLKWLRKTHALTPEQLTFFDAGRLKRLLRKFL